MVGLNHSRHTSLSSGILPDGMSKSPMNGVEHITLSSWASKQSNPSPRGLTIPQFFCICSRYELDWFIQETSVYLGSHLEKGSFPREEHAVYDSSFAPENIRIEPARRAISFPQQTGSSGVEIAASFLAGLVFVACASNTENKASRVRYKITAITALKGIHSTLCHNASSSSSPVTLHLVRSIQVLFLKEKKDLIGSDIGVVGTKFNADILPPDFLPLRPIDSHALPLPSSIIVTRPPRTSTINAHGKSTLIIPSAGRSSRFPGHKPKWLLTMPNGRLMVVDAIAALNLERVHRVVLGVLKEHVDKHCGSDISTILKAFEDGPACLDKIEISIVIISTETVDQVQTIECMLKTAQVTGPIFLKDCDNQFRCDIPGVDGVASLEITKDMQSLNIPAGKSYLIADSNNHIDNIVEKVILGPTFCVGGYSFADGVDMLRQVLLARFCQRITNATTTELAVSDVIWLKMITSYCLRTNEEGQPDGDDAAVANFTSIPAVDYEDWGTLQAWETYARTFRTLFLDIDGTLIKNSGGYFKPTWGMQPELPRSIAHLQTLYKKGRTQIILTTSRPESFRKITEKQLEDAGIPYDQILFGMFHAQRVLVNDFAKTNPFPSAAAINLRRDGDELPEMLGFY